MINWFKEPATNGMVVLCVFGALLGHSISTVIWG